nr:TPA_inf: ATP synthase 6 [Antarctophthirus carlinii]
MTSSLLSVFDPCSSAIPSSALQLKWLCLILPIFTVTPYWYAPSSFHVLYLHVSEMLKTQLNLSSQGKSSTLILVSLFVFIFMSNSMTLLPLGFIPSSHFMFNMSLCFTLWLSGLLYEFVNSPSKLSSSLVPSNSPLILGPFLVLIELVSLLIQPVSLSVRLMSNLMAGHILLVLLESVILSVSLSFPYLLLFTFGMLFELMVCVIQSFVVCNLLSIYWNKNTS